MFRARSSTSPVASFGLAVPGSRSARTPSTRTTNSLRTVAAIAWASGDSWESTTTWVIP